MELEQKQEGEGEAQEEKKSSTPRVTPLQVMRASQELQGEPDRQLLNASSLYEKVFLISLVRLCADEENSEKTKTLSQVSRPHNLSLSTPLSLSLTFWFCVTIYYDYTHFFLLLR